MPALLSSIIGPLWHQFAALIPLRDSTHSLEVPLSKHQRPDHLRQAIPILGTG